MADFDTEYTSLNDAQKEAVDQLDGPLLVVAGPGTGKTQLLSMRAANILNKTDTNPENILCLTYTEKAAINMQRRLRDIIGREGSKVMIKTFHSLGQEIIASSAENFFSGAQLQPIPQAVQLDILDNLLSRLPLSNKLALRFAGKNTQLHRVKKSIQLAKEAGLTPDKLHALAEANIAYCELILNHAGDLFDQRISKNVPDQYHTFLDDLPLQDMNIPPFRAYSEVFIESLSQALETAREANTTKALSSWKNNWTEVVDKKRTLKDIRRSSWWRGLADVYESYQQRMHKRGYYDFSDMILETLTALEQNETLRAEWSERFNYIMIDEFQDTNDAQFRLSYLLARHEGDENRPNIMAVGDDDQAIYRFQGADITNVENFERSFSDTHLVVLTENYRSHQSVLDCASSIAEQIDNRLVNHKPTLNKKINATNDIPMGTIEHVSYSSRMHQLNDVALRAGRALEQEKSVAVLARNHDSLEALASVLHARNVPISYERRLNILEQSVVRLITDYLQVLRAIGVGDIAALNASLARALSHPMSSIEPEHLWRLAIKARAGSNWLDLISQDDSLQPLAQWLISLAQLARHEPVSIVIEHVLGMRTHAGFQSPLHALTTKKQLSTEYMTSLSAINTIRRLASEFTDGAPELDDFLNFIELNRSHNVVIADESVFTTSPNAVQLLSSHKAKGLEFDDVFIIDVIESVWSPGRTRHHPPHNLTSLQEYGEDMDDYARLLFVSATRARSSLITSSFRINEQGREVLASSLIDHLPSRHADESTISPVEIAEEMVRWPRLNHSKRKELLAPVLEKFTLSVTSLINFLDLERGGPEYFMERNVLRLPDVKSPSLGYGTAIHAALRTAQELVNQNTTDSEKVKERFTNVLAQQQLESHEFKRYVEKGLELLPELLSRLDLKKGAQPERSIKVTLGDARLSGSLDRLDSTDSSITIIDYKTGSPLMSELSTESKTYAMKAWRHRTQLIFYHLLMEQKGLVGKRAVTGEMIYVESDTAKHFRKQYKATERELEKLEKVIQGVWELVYSQDLPDISGYSTDFVGTQEFIQDILERRTHAKS